MRVVICGAGIAGLALANCMSALGAEVVLLERAPGPRTQGYMIDFFGPGYDAAEAMGILPAIEQVAYPVDQADLVDEHGRRRARIPYGQLAGALGGRLLSVLRSDLEQVLREALPPAVEVRFGTGPAVIEDHHDGIRVTLDDGAELGADLLVGADGVHSTVRRLVFGEQRSFVRYLGFHTAAFLFEDAEIRAATQGRFCLTDSVGRQMGFYGLRDGRVAAFAVHRTSDPTLPGDLRAAVRESYGGLRWVAPRALEKCPPSADIYYDQVAQIEMPKWSNGRALLLGDSCYAVSLLAGQGASLALAGAYLLAHQLDRAPSIEDAIAEYERLWRPVVEEKQRAGRDAARWFLPESRLQLHIRRAVLRASTLPVVNHYVGRMLAGKSTTLIANLRHAHGLPQSSG